ncbi:MAG: two-component response regulator [Eubacterium sp.]|nr:two-component response regulator [Eubacterium sp.]
MEKFINDSTPGINPCAPAMYHPAYSVEDTPLEMAKYLLCASYKHLFSVPLFYNFVLLLNTNLSVVAYHINYDFMSSPIKLCNGLNFSEEKMGKTSISESCKENQISVEYSEKCSNPLFSSYTNCTVPIISDTKTVGYLSAFILSSKNDEIAVKYFLLFSKLIMSNLKYHSVKSNIDYYLQEAMLPNFNMSALSDSEKRVLNYLKKGDSNKEICNQLFISENTIKSHVQLISHKLSCENRTQIAVNTVLSEIKELIKK